MRDSKRDRRIDTANRLIQFIAENSESFHFLGTTSKFQLDRRGRIRFSDSFSRKSLLVWAKWKRNNGFSESHELREMVRGLADYIRGRGMTTNVPSSYADAAKGLGIHEVSSN